MLQIAGREIFIAFHVDYVQISRLFSYATNLWKETVYSVKCNISKANNIPPIKKYNEVDRGLKSEIGSSSIGEDIGGEIL